MSVQDEIKLNLQNLFDNSFKIIQAITFEKMVDNVVKELSEIYVINPDKTITKGLGKEEIEKINAIRKNRSLKEAFEAIKGMDYNEKEMVKSFKNDILNAIESIKKNINANFKNQIIFLEHNYEPYAYFCGFGIGEYPILKKPEYFDFNYKEELYNGIGKLDYSKLWKDKTFIENTLFNIDTYGEISSSNLFKNTIATIKYKTYLLLNQSFNELPVDVFDGIPIEKPLMIYGNEHDCEPINIFCYN